MHSLSSLVLRKTVFGWFGDRFREGCSHRNRAASSDAPKGKGDGENQVPFRIRKAWRTPMKNERQADQLSAEEKAILAKMKKRSLLSLFSRPVMFGFY